MTRMLFILLLFTGAPAAGQQNNQREAQIRTQVQQEMARRIQTGRPLTPTVQARQGQTTSWKAKPSNPQPQNTQPSSQSGQWTGEVVSKETEKQIGAAPIVPRGYDTMGGSCEIAITNAERQYNLPPYILHAIAVTESGRNGRPYPFAMNIQGRSHYANNANEMVDIINGYGPRPSIDVGCVQVNLKYHGHRLGDWRRLIDPATNAQYAAFHLVELFREFGSWSAAVAAYHSRTQWRGVNYACLVSRNYGQILGDYRQGCGPSIEHLAAYLYANVKR